MSVRRSSKSRRASSRSSRRDLEAQRFRGLARRASDVVLILDAAAHVQYMSPSAERLMGYREDDWLERDALQTIHPDDLELAAGAFGRALAQPGVNEPLEVRVRQVGGGWRWFEVVATNLIDDPAIGGVVIAARDVTERVEAREALRRSEERLTTNARRFEAMLANLSDMVSVIDAHGDMTYVSPAAQRLVGRRAEDRVGASIFDYVHPDDAELAAAKLAELLAAPGLLEPFETRLRHEDGSYRVFEVSANNLLEDPAVQGIIINSRDITDRVAAEGALRERERLYRTIVESADEGIWMVDGGSRTSFVNSRMAQILGTTTVAMIGRELFDFVDDEDRDAVSRNIERRRSGISERHDIRLRRSDGSTFWAMISASPLTDEAGTYQGAIALVTDISDRRRSEAALRQAAIERHDQQAEIERHRLEAQLVEAQRLESLGRLAGGVAHDFNNLIGVILNYTAAIAKQLDETGPAAADLGQIQRAAEQAAGLTRKLLIFGRVDRGRPETLDVNQLVIEAMQLFDRPFGDAIVIETKLDPTRCFAHIDPSQIEQVLMNLLVNARDALPDGGTITVTTARVSHDDTLGPHVVLSVSDDGTGMAPDVVQHAFEPFFTTKLLEHGTGLGLATVRAIVRGAGGTVSIESQLGVGTTVSARLPSRAGRLPAQLGA